MLRRLPPLLSLLAIIPALLGAGEPLPSGALRRLGVAIPVQPRTPDAEDQEAEQRQRRAEEMRSVKEVCIADEGKTAITCKGDGTFQTWEMATGKLVHRWRLGGDRSGRLSPDGKVVAVVGIDNTLVLHAADTGKLLRRFSRPLPADLCSLTFSADGKTLIAGHFKPADFSVWDVATGQMLYSAKSTGDIILTAASSSDGKVLALGGMEGRLRIWDRATQKVRCEHGGYGQLWDLAFSPTETLLAGLAAANRVWLWDTRSYQPVRRLSWRGPQASFVAFSPDGKLLACNAGRDVVLWEVATGKVRRTFSGHQGPVTSAVFTADGKQLLTGSGDGSVLVWDPTALPPTSPAAPVRKDRHGDPLPPAARARLGSLRLYLQDSCFRLDLGGQRLAFAADGKSLFVGLPPPEGEEREAEPDLRPSDSAPGIHVLEVPSGKEGPRPENVPEAIDCLARSPDGKTLAALLGPTLYLWDAPTGKKRRMAHSDLQQARVLAFSPDGHLLAAADEEQIEILDADSGRCLHRLQGHPPEVVALAFSGDGKQLVSCSRPEHRQLRKDRAEVYPGAVVTWAVAGGKSVGRMTIPADGELHSFCLAPDGTTLAASHKESIRLWDVGTGRQKRSLPAAAGALAFSPDGKLLATAGPGLRLWDHAAGKEVRSFPATNSPVRHMLFSPDGKRLATMAGMRVHFWDVLRGQEVVPQEGHWGTIAALACSADGKLVLSGGEDRAVCVWEVAAGKLLRRLQGHEADVTTLALSPDGKLAASQDAAGRVILWDVATGRPLRQARMPELAYGYGPVTHGQGAAFSADGRLLLVSGATGLARLWRVSSWKELRSFQTNEHPHAPLTLSPDGTLLALPDQYRRRGAYVSLRETSTGGERWRIERKDWGAHYLAAAFTPDGSHLAVSWATFHSTGLAHGLGEGQIALYDSTTGKEVHVLDTDWPASVLSFSPDGKLLATATGTRVFPWAAIGVGADSHFRLWDVRTGKLLGEVDGHKAMVTALAFSADGRTLFSTGLDGTVLVWDVRRLLLQQPRRPRDASTP